MVQSRVEDLSPVVKKVSVELTPDRVSDALDRQFSGLSRTVKLKGYRQGHVPKRLVERYYGEEVRKSVAQQLVQASIAEALTEHKLTPVAPPRVENGDVQPGEPFRYTATVEVRPHVDPKDYTGLSAPRVDASVTEEEIDARIEELRDRQAVFAPVEGRDVLQEGDYASASYEGFLDGAPLQGAKRDGVLIEIAEGSLLENKSPELAGAKVGETRELTVPFPADYAVADLRGKSARFRVVLQGIKRRELPALDDAFVQDLGGEAKTVAGLREQLKTEQAQKKKQGAEAAQREALLSALIAKNPVEAPPALVERNVDQMLQGMVEGFYRRGLDPRQLGLNLDRMRDELRERALLEVKGYLLLEAIAAKEKLEVSDADLEAHLQKLADEFKQPVETLRKALVGQDALDGLKDRLRQDKALAFLLAKANLG